MADPESMHLVWERESYPVSTSWCHCVSQCSFVVTSWYIYEEITDMLVLIFLVRERERSKIFGFQIIEKNRILKCANFVKLSSNWSCSADIHQAEPGQHAACLVQPFLSLLSAHTLTISFAFWFLQNYRIQ